jgi:hypothetical protein
MSLQEGDETMAVHHFRESISWYLPVAPWREDAAEALWDMHEKQIAAGKHKEAVQSLSMLRAGLMASRSIFGTDTLWRGRVDEALAPLMAQWEAKAAAQEGRPLQGDLAARKTHFAQILAEDTLPHRGLGLLVVFGCILWVVGVWRATGLEGKERVKYLGIGALGFTLFVVGLSLA